MSVAPRPADAEASATVARQFKPPIAFRKCGDAEPNVNAPTSKATSNPISFSAQLAAIFMPTGYTPAMHIPTTKRRAGIPKAAGSSKRIDKFATAAIAAAVIKKRRRFNRSASPKNPLNSVPITNPTCTLLVSSDTWNDVSVRSFCNDGTTAVVENQSASTSTWQTQISVMTRHFWDDMCDDDPAKIGYSLQYPAAPPRMR